MTPHAGNADLSRLRQMMAARGARRMYAKVLAANDNSKNQPYFGGDFSVLNILPAGTPKASTAGLQQRPIFKTALKFSWLADDGNVYPAPGAQLILYPQYPEVRFSGYLRGCEEAPSELMGTTRVPGRLLFLGVCDDGRILGYAASPDSPIAHEFHALGQLQQFGVFVEVPLLAQSGAGTTRAELLRTLCRIAGKDWIRSKRLSSDGSLRPCSSPNCGGYTLEAELGVRPNGNAEPDYLGWEIKQYAVSDFVSLRGGPVTLMTPEPSAGLYAEEGVFAFVERYGYEDTKGREDRRNFGGVHRVAERCARTDLTLMLLGYDADAGKIIDPGKGIALVDADGREAALWLYSDLMSHWNRKHALAAYVPSQSRKTPAIEYRYASRVRLGTGTDFLRFLRAMAKGTVYYDPGIKIEEYSSASPKSKRRSQFRIRSQDLDALYERMETVDACAAS